MVQIIADYNKYGSRQYVLKPRANSPHEGIAFPSFAQKKRAVAYCNERGIDIEAPNRKTDKDGNIIRKRNSACHCRILDASGKVIYRNGEWC